LARLCEVRGWIPSVSLACWEGDLEIKHSAPSGDIFCSRYATHFFGMFGMFLPESFVFISICLLFKISSNGNFRAKTLFLLRNEFLGFQNRKKISPQARRAGLRPAIAGPGKPRDELRPALLTPRSHSPKTAKRFKSAM